MPAHIVRTFRQEKQRKLAAETYLFTIAMSSKDTPHYVSEAGNPLVLPSSSYAPLPDERGSLAMAQAAKENERTRTKSEACCSCVFLCLLIFLFTFFLVPRKPDLFLEEVTIDASGGNVTGVVGKFHL